MTQTEYRTQGDGVAVKVETPLHARLKRLADQRSQTVKVVASQAVREYLEKEEGK